MVGGILVVHARSTIRSWVLPSGSLFPLAGVGRSTTVKMRAAVAPLVVRRSARFASKGILEGQVERELPSKTTRRLSAAGGQAAVKGLPTAGPKTTKRSLKKKVSETTLATDAKEESLRELGFRGVCGVDEAGRGPLAGPVVAAACVLLEGSNIEGLQDSKKLTEPQREKIFDELTKCPQVAYAVEVVDAAEIDRVNILQATMAAMAASISKLHAEKGPSCFDYVLIDGNRIPDSIPDGCKAEAVIKGDASCRVIAAASILAKVTRDRLMLAYDREFPQYGFKEHKGYGTAKHMSALLKHGPSPIHRRSFAPLKDWISLGEDAPSSQKVQGKERA